MEDVDESSSSSSPLPPPLLLLRTSSTPQHREQHRHPKEGFPGGGGGGGGDDNDDVDDIAIVTPCKAAGHLVPTTLDTPLPRAQMLILSCVILAEPVSFGILYPFIYFMVCRLGILVDDNVISISSLMSGGLSRTLLDSPGLRPRIRPHSIPILRSKISISQMTHVKSATTWDSSLLPSPWHSLSRAFLGVLYPIA